MAAARTSLFREHVIGFAQCRLIDEARYRDVTTKELPQFSGSLSPLSSVLLATQKQINDLSPK